VVHSNPIAGTILAELDLTEGQMAAVRDALDDLARARSGADGSAVLTAPINIGTATK
jgi:hypothetical protein